MSIDDGTWELEDSSDQISPQKAAETSEVCAVVREAVRALPVSLRESVLMFYFQQMSVRQIAETLEVNENTVVYDSVVYELSEETTFTPGAEMSGFLRPSITGP